MVCIIFKFISIFNLMELNTKCFLHKYVFGYEVSIYDSKGIAFDVMLFQPFRLRVTPFSFLKNAQKVGLLHA